MLLHLVSVVQRCRASKPEKEKSGPLGPPNIGGAHRASRLRCTVQSLLLTVKHTLCSKNSGHDTFILPGFLECFVQVYAFNKMKSVLAETLQADREDSS